MWKNYTKTKKLDVSEYPDPLENGPRLRMMSGALGHLGGSQKRMAGCRGFGKHEKKYEFEPERRLEGFKKRKAT